MLHVRFQRKSLDSSLFGVLASLHDANRGGLVISWLSWLGTGHMSGYLLIWRNAFPLGWNHTGWLLILTTLLTLFPVSSLSPNFFPLTCEQREWGGDTRNQGSTHWVWILGLSIKFDTWQLHLSTVLFRPTTVYHVLSDQRLTIAMSCVRCGGDSLIAHLIISTDIQWLMTERKMYS